MIAVAPRRGAKGFIPQTRDSQMVSQHQAVGRDIGARVQASIRKGGEQDRVGNSGCRMKPVSRLAVFLGPAVVRKETPCLRPLQLSRSTTKRRERASSSFSPRPINCLSMACGALDGDRSRNGRADFS